VAAGLGGLGRVLGRGPVVSLRYRSASLPGLEVLSCRSDFSFDAHMHSGAVLWLNSAGGEHFSVRGSSEVLQPGCLSLIAAGVVHANRPCGGGPRDLRSLYLEESFFADLACRLELPSLRPPSAPSRMIADHRLWRATAALHQGIMNGVECLDIEQQVLHVFVRLLAPWQQPLPATRTQADPSPRLREMIDFLHAGHSERVTLGGLARIGQCSEMHVLRLFKSGVGMTPHGYLTQVRLEQARRLIAAGVPLADAALGAGFADQSHLTRRFRRRYGLTPAAYRRQLRQI